MSVDNNAQHSGISAERKPYIVCFVGLDKDFETLLIDLIPDAQVLSFVAPALSVTEIEDAAVDLLDYLYDNYPLVNKENEWNSIALVTQGVTGFIVKQAMNLASTDKKYQGLAFLVSDLIFIETPHRIGNGSTWQAALEVVLDSDSQPLQDKFLRQVEATCASFLCTAKKYCIVNILAPSSSLVVGNFDRRILDYWLETTIVMTGPLTTSDIRERIEDLERLRQILAPPHMTQLDLKFPVRDYLARLTDLSWSWRRVGDYGHWENKEFTMHGHLNHTRLDCISLFIQLIGPAGCGKKTLLRHLAFTRNRSPQTTTMLLVKDDFNTLKDLQLDVLKSFICQVLWQRPFLFTTLETYLDTFTDAERWTESSLWSILRFLCQARWLGRLSLYIADISDWLLPLRPLLRFLQSASAVQLSIITTSREANLTELPPETVVIDVLADCDWDNGIATIIYELLSEQPWLGDPSIQDKIQKHLQQCRGDYLTAYIYLKQVSRVTVIPTQAAIEQSLDQLSPDREQIYHNCISSVIDGGIELSRWCSQALSWILSACRPLTVPELSVAVAISHAAPCSSMAEVEKHITVGMWEVLSRHLGLFLRREGQVVLLIHETARDALLSFEKDGFALLDHSNLAQLCLEYLSLVLPSQSDSMLDTKGGAFLAYAVNYWPEHSLLADKVLQRDLVAEKKTSLDHRIHSFLSSPSLRDKWYQLFRKRAISQPAPTLLEIASELGLTSVVEKILVDKDRLEVQDHELQRSLQLATANGCQNITSLLLCRNAVLSPSLPVASVHNRLMILEQLLHYTSKCKIQPRTEYVTQALQAASRSGSLEALDMLMKYVKMTMPDFDLVSNIPLEEAADRQHAEIMAFLLKELEEIMHLSRDDPRVMSGALEQKARGALHAACKRGDEGLVHRLLHWGIAPTVQGLEIAVESGHPMIVKTFLAELSPRQDDTSWLHNSCALIKAAETGRLDIVELLVAAGSPINLVLGDSETALHKAVRNGHKEIAEYLVMHGAERYLPNNDDLTPAQLATQSGYLLIFKAVQELPQPANFNSYIRLAAENGHILMIRYLLRLDHQPINGSDELLTVALATAASKGYLAVVRELCQAKVDVNCRTGEISALHKAGSQGHHQIVEYLLSQGADANASNQIRQTPLHESVKYPLVVKLLIANGSDVEATDLDDRTPLHLAVIAKGDSSETSGLEESIQLLLDAGADVTITDEGGNTALHLAAKHSFLWAANALLSHQAKLSPNLDGQTALHIAAERGNLSILSLLLEKNASMINTADGQGKIPLLCASESGSMECIKVLAAHGSDIDRQSDSGNTPLNVAAVSGNLEIVRFLLQNNADAEIANKRQETPLISTSWGNHVEVAKALLEHGAKMETVNYTCCSPLNLAAKRSHLTLARLLLDHGADTESIDNYRRTPLYSAVQYGSLAIATVLLDHGANVEAADSSGLTPLTLACHRGILDIVTLLLNHGASIEAADDEGWRPLASAVAPGHYDVVRFLIERGANIEAANSYGWRPLGLAAHHGWSNIVQLLLDRKADPDAANSGTWTALESAADQGHYDVARLLVSRGADIEAPDGRALYNAMFHDHFDVCRYLIEQGTNVNAQTSLGETALHVAVRKEQTDIIRLLIEHGADLSATDEFGFTALHVAIRFCAAESAAILLESTASMTCTDLSGRTPIDWLPMQKADGFFKQIPALKGFQPTSQNDRESKTRESLIGIINELEKPDVDQGDLLYRARYLSSQLGDMSCAIRCFVQTATFNSKEKSFELLGFYCDICENEMKHHGYFCTSCPDIDICDGCMEKHKKEPSLRECIGHDYQEFRVPRPDSDNIPDSQSTLKALVEDMRAKYGKA